MIPIAAAAPLDPIYPFNEPGQAILLHEGMIGGLAPKDIKGRIELSCTPKLNIEWIIDHDQNRGSWANMRTMTLSLRRTDGDVQVAAFRRDHDSGWLNSASVGAEDAPLDRVIAHWFNLPRWFGPEKLSEVTASGAQSWWTGRWTMVASGWRVTVDVRPDHNRVWTDLHKSDVYVMTHVMEIRRADGARFTAQEADPVLAALHIGVSFALGRFAAPALRVGLQADGTVVWEDWRPYLCSAARHVTGGWWYDRDHAALTELVDRTVAAFLDPDRREPVRLQMMFAITAVNDEGFTEQRIMMAAAGLEHIMWQSLVLSNRLTEDEYGGWVRDQGRKLRAQDNLRTVLTEAKIPYLIDPVTIPATVRFLGQRPGQSIDGATAVTQVRNRLVHPKGTQENVYKHDGLIGEVWLLARHFLVLLVLHSLDYRGDYQDLTRTTGMVGDVAKVPWA